MLSFTQIQTMLRLQDEMNSKVDPNWIEVKNPFLRAAGVEAIECLEHIGWKWWKKQDKDLAQAQMELVDIWHFALSDFILKHGSQRAAAVAIHEAPEETGFDFDGQHYELESMDLQTKLEMLCALAAVRRFELSLFGALLKDCEMAWPDLFNQYVGKNVLNLSGRTTVTKQVITSKSGVIARITSILQISLGNCQMMSLTQKK